jgi:ribonuclease T2
MRAFVVVFVLVVVALVACAARLGSERVAEGTAPGLVPVLFGGGLHGGTPNPDPRSTACAGGPADATPFALYVLALSWAPDFCCKNPEREECQELGTGYGGSHLTLHGLWPTYDDREAAEHGYDWPELCGDCSRCRRGSPACSPDRSVLPDGMAKYGPGYVTDHDFLTGHEWAHHGACSGLSPAAFFGEALAAMLRLPGAGTPDPVRANAGGSVPLRELEAALEPRGAVLLGCDAECYLTQVAYCLGRDAGGAPAGLTACPRSARGEGGNDNGCVVQGCSMVRLRKAGDTCGE